MCIETGRWNSAEIKFFRDNVFHEKGQIIVNNPINSDDTNNNFVPDKIALSKIEMAPGKKEEIVAQINRERNKKIVAKSKRQKKAL